MIRKGVFFDLDGTLWDASDMVACAWTSCLEKETGGKVRLDGSDMRALMGKLMEEIARIVLPDETEKRQLEVLGKCTAVEEFYLRDHFPALFENEYEILKKLYDDGYTLAVISNCQKGYIEIYLEQCGFITLFGDMECAGRTGMEKDKNIRLVCERNGILPENCVYIGDTAGDEKAARGAGVKFIHAAYGYGKAVSPDRSAKSFSEIYELVNSVI